MTLQDAESIGNAGEGPPTSGASPAVVQNRGRTRIRCASCNRPNQADCRFCAYCGASLFQTCLKCGAAVAIEHEYCGACGASRAETVKRKRRELRDRMDLALALRAEHRYDEAIDALAPIAKPEREAAGPESHEADRLLEEIAREKQQREAEAEEAFQLARRRCDAHAYGEAIAALEAVPPPLFSAEARRLLEEARRKLREVKEIHSRIRAAVKANRLVELSLCLERLLTLRPEDKTARKLARQTANRLVRAADKALAEHRYDQAMKLVQKIPAAARTDEADRIGRSAAELNWLLTELRTAPFADRTLLAIGQRLVRSSPEDRRAAELLRQLQERRRRRSVDSDLGDPAWAKPPAETAVGYPVDQLIGFQTIRRGDPDRLSELKERPASFYVACGLALQVLGLGPVRVHLARLQRESVLSKLRLNTTRKPPPAAWGLDLGDSSLKAVKLVRGADDNVTLDAAVFLPSERPGPQASEAQQRRRLRETLEQFISRCELDEGGLGVALPGRRVFTRLLRIPPLKKRIQSDVVAYEARQVLPFPLDELVWDCQPIAAAPSGEDASSGPRCVLLLAARDGEARGRAALLSDCGLRPDLLQGDFVALHNFLLFDRRADLQPDGESDSNAQPAIAALDVGATSSSFLVSAPDLLWRRHIDLGGNRFTNALVDGLHQTRSRAEQLKFAPETAARLSEFQEAIRPASVQLAGEIRRSLEAFQRAFPDRRVHRVYGLGGGFRLHGLLRFLRLGF